MGPIKSDEPLVKRKRGRPPGSGGRPKGIPNKATVEAKAAARAIVDDPVYRAALKARIHAGLAHPSIEALMHYYAHGKPDRQR